MRWGGGGVALGVGATLTLPNCCGGSTADGAATILLEKVAAAAGAVVSFVVNVTCEALRCQSQHSVHRKQCGCVLDSCDVAYAQFHSDSGRCLSCPNDPVQVLQSHKVRLTSNRASVRLSGMHGLHSRDGSIPPSRHLWSSVYAVIHTADSRLGTVLLLHMHSITHLNGSQECRLHRRQELGDRILGERNSQIHLRTFKDEHAS